MRSKNCIAVTLLVALLSSCMGRMVGGGSGAPGGEVTGVSTTAWNEPAPYGMVLIKRGSLKMGPEEQDSLWGAPVPTKEISVESFWMDETEVSVAKYKQFVYWVRDSIIRERLADPAYGGNELYKIEEDREGNLSNLILTGRNLFHGEKPQKMSRWLSRVFIGNIRWMGR